MEDRSHAMRRAWHGSVWVAAMAASAAAGAVSIVSSSPSGEVAQVRQVVVRFSGPVVAFGDLRLPDPVAIACVGTPVRGSGRWSDERTWLYDFRSNLAPGSRCTATLRDDWKPLPVAGAITGAKSFAFTTGGPAVASLTPSDNTTIEEDQHFLLRLTGPAVPASVAANVWCEVQGHGERLPVVAVEGAVRESLLKDRGIAKAEDAARTLLLRCPRPFPQDTDVRLVWGRGIAAAANPRVVTSVEQRWSFHVRPAFTAEFSCQREKADRPCVPLLPMTVAFSAPIARAAAEQIRLAPAGGGAALRPVFAGDDREPWLRSIAFPTPLAENAAFSIELPRDLRDDAGRPLANAASFPLQVRTAAAPPIAKFAAAPFGIVERTAESALPVTLRHVQGELRPSAATPVGQVRTRRLTSDAEILEWYARLAQYHESQMTAQELGLPRREWYTFEDDTDSRGRPIKRRVERRVGTREVSLLATDAAARKLALPQLEGGDPRPFEVIGIPLAEPGYHVVEIESPRLGQSLLDKRAPLYVRTGVLVTNLGVHFKHGRENSVVWVTTLDRGQPVEGAELAVADCNGRPLWSGRTDAKGLAVVARALDALPETCRADNGLFVSARKAAGDGAAGGADIAFVFSSWQKGIEPWRFSVPTGRGAEAELRASTVFDRALFRAGETVSMKHFIRLETTQGLAPVPADRLPTRMKIVHQGSGQEYTQPLAWRGNGRSAANAWQIPPAAKLGIYEVTLDRGSSSREGGGAGERINERPADGEIEGESRSSRSSGTFRVEEFRLPLVDARVSGPKTVQVAPAGVLVDVLMNYFSGGAMAGAPLRASALLKPRSPTFAGFEEFTFAAPRVPKASGAGSSGDEDAAPDTQKGQLIADKLALQTDRNGVANFVLKDLPPTRTPAQIDAEITFADPNGETQTVSTTIALWPSAVVLGVRAGSWASNRGRAKWSVIALDTTGKPIKGQSIAVHGRVSQVITSRKRLVGGFYGYDNRTDVKDLGTLCTGTSDDRGLVSCEASLDTAGQVELIAEAKDAQGRPAVAAGTVWITRQGELWFSQDNDDRIDVLPEKKRYEPGEMAKLQVRMPFREATALVAIEREGVLATQVVTLRGDDPTVQLKIEPGWGPNVYVSVLALRGRIRETPWYSFFTWGWKEPVAWWRSWRGDGVDYAAPTAMVDLSKPAFKLGVAKLTVGLAAHELQVAVATDKTQYQIRQKVTTRVRVTFQGLSLIHI